MKCGFYANFVLKDRQKMYYPSNRYLWAKVNLKHFIKLCDSTFRSKNYIRI